MHLANVAFQVGGGQAQVGMGGRLGSMPSRMGTHALGPPPSLWFCVSKFPGSV